MENVIINPKNYQAEYIRHINECFNGWGQDQEYEWAFNRKVGTRAADIMILKNEEDEVIAGSAVTYRNLQTPEGKSIDIAIMTGSWTLPKARGRGCFSKIIQLSKEIAAQNGVPYLTAFVTESNASYRRLRDAGSSLLPTRLLFSPESPISAADRPEVRTLECTPSVVDDLYERFKSSQQHSLSYTYTKEEFFQQYLHRPKNPEILLIGKEYALVEETHNVLKVLLLTYEEVDTFERILTALANWAQVNRSKKLYLFSTKPEIEKVCERLGFELVPGYFTILPTSEEEPADPAQLMQLHINMGDKM